MLNQNVVAKLVKSITVKQVGTLQLAVELMEKGKVTTISAVATSWQIVSSSKPLLHVQERTMFV